MLFRSRCFGEHGRVLEAADGKPRVADADQQLERALLQLRGHAQGLEDWRALLDFADAQFFKKKPKRKFDILPYKDAKPPINWKAPADG